MSNANFLRVKHVACKHICIAHLISVLYGDLERLLDFIIVYTFFQVLFGSPFEDHHPFWQAVRKSRTKDESLVLTCRYHCNH